MKESGGPALVAQTPLGLLSQGCQFGSPALPGSHGFNAVRPAVHSRPDWAYQLTIFTLSIAHHQSFPASNKPKVTTMFWAPAGLAIPMVTASFVA